MREDHELMTLSPMTPEHAVLTFKIQIQNFLEIWKSRSCDVSASVGLQPSNPQLRSWTVNARIRCGSTFWKSVVRWINVMLMTSSSDETRNSGGGVDGCWRCGGREIRHWREQLPLTDAIEKCSDFQIFRSAVNQQLKSHARVLGSAFPKFNAERSLY